MPFYYFGGKKGLARYYPPPAFSTIIEPFAGSAGYALHFATPARRVILIEKDPAVVTLWRRLQAPDARDDLLAIELPAARLPCSEPLVMLCQGGVGGNEKLLRLTDGRAKSFIVTPWMRSSWPSMRSSIISALPIIRSWTIIEGDYTEAPDLHGTHFIDPPYWVPADARGTRGDGYRHGADAIDFDALAAWCRARKGQVIVCEQQGATWLPFRPLRRWQTASGLRDSQRVEVVWTRTPGQSLASAPAARKAAETAATRRAARARRS